MIFTLDRTYFPRTILIYLPAVDCSLIDKQSTLVLTTSKLDAAISFYLNSNAQMSK
jgi:hypothetical protein